MKDIEKPKILPSDLAKLKKELRANYLYEVE